MTATAKQKKEIARLLTTDSEIAPLEFAEAQRLISGLKRDRFALPGKELITEIVLAKNDDDFQALGSALCRAKSQTKHGHWLAFLNMLEIHPRAAQRLMKEA